MKLHQVRILAFSYLSSSTLVIEDPVSLSLIAVGRVSREA